MHICTDIAVISVDADLDATAAARVRGAIDAVMERGCRRVVLNMDGAAAIDAAGLAMIVAKIRALRDTGGLLSLVNVHERVYRRLRLGRIVDFVPVSKAGPRPRVPELPPAAHPLWRCALTVEPQHMAAARTRVGELLSRMSFTADEAFDLTLAVGEAMGNAVDHAGGRVIVTIAAYADRAVVEVTDSGCGFELADDEMPAADGCVERGRGIALMRMLADAVTICRRPSGTGTCARIVKLMHGSARASAQAQEA